MRKKKNSKLRSALAIFLAGAMVLGMIPGGMGQVYASDSTPTPAVAFDETSVSDPSTVDTWNQVVKDSTENIGRIWTDKTDSQRIFSLRAEADQVSKKAILIS